MDDNMRQKEAIKVHKWIAKNPRVVHRMINLEDNITPQECIELIEILEEQSLEYLIPILLYTVDNNGVISKAIARVNAESLSMTWESMGTAQMLTDIKNKIRKETELKEMRNNDSL